MRSADRRRALTGTPESDGYYYAPTVFDRVPPDSPLAVEEIFGPVLPILRVRDLDEAIAIANSTRYGLAASLFTSRLGYVHEFTSRVQAGMIHVNHGTASQAHVPFGGVKDSGQGAYSIGPTAQRVLYQCQSRLRQVVSPRTARRSRSSSRCRRRCWARARTGRCGPAS